MANGIGKITMGRQSAQSALTRGSTKGITSAFAAETAKREEDTAFGMKILGNIASISSKYKKNTESWDKYEAGKEEAGLEVENANFLEKMSRGFGLKNVDLSKKHQGAGGAKEYTGAELMNIGEKSQLGTLASFLDGGEIGDKYGSKSKGYQAFEKFGKEGQEWGAFRDKEILGKGVPQVQKGALGAGTDVGGPDGLLSDDDLMSTIGTPPGMLNKGDSYQSLVKDTYGKKEISQGQWEKQAMREQFPVDQSRVDAIQADPASYGAGPKDPLRNQRLKISQGVEEGVFDEGFSLEDMWASNDKSGLRPELPYEEMQPEELTSDDMNLDVQPIDMNDPSMGGGPADPLGKQRDNLMMNQLGTGKNMSLEDVWKEQEKLNNLLEYDYSEGGLAVSVTGQRR